MRNIRSRRAFTLIELIIVIVILGILAAIAIVGYQAVINRANESKVEQAALSYDRSLRALAAFDQGNPQAVRYHVDMLSDVPEGFEVTYSSSIVADDDVEMDLLDAADFAAERAGAQADLEDWDGSVVTVTFSDGVTSVALTVSSSASVPGTTN